MGEQLENLLKEGNEEYQKEDDDTPIGPSFMMQLQNAELAVSSTGKAMIKRHHLIIDGEYEGVSVHDNLFPLSAGFAKKRFKDWCTVMNFEPPETAMDIEETVAEIVSANPVYMGSIAKSGKDGDFTNVRCTKLLEEETGPAKKKPAGAKKTRKTEPEPDGQDEPDEIAKGDTVTFTDDDDGSEVTGTVKKIKNGKAYIDTPKADYADVPVGSLTLVGEEGSDGEGEGEDDDDEELNDLIALAQANDIDVDDDTEMDDLVEALKAHTWKKDELADDEVELLEGVGVKFKAKVRPKAETKKSVKKGKKKAKRR